MPITIVPWLIQSRLRGLLGVPPVSVVELTPIIRKRHGHRIVAIGHLPEGYLWALACWGRGGRYISRRPSMAFSMVTSSVYSMSLPTGMPMAMRVTRNPCLCRFSCWAR